MIKNHRLAKSISDSSWDSFFQKLEYKAERAGILFRKISPYNTSQKCSMCSNLVKKSLVIRTHRCPFCGLKIDRDHNASRNIKQKGLDSLPVECREVTPLERKPLTIVSTRYSQVISKNEETNSLNYWHFTHAII